MRVTSPFKRQRAGSNPAIAAMQCSSGVEQDMSLVAFCLAFLLK